MANGKFHGKKHLGIRIKNPLPLTVEVTVLDGKGFSPCRTIKPGAEVYVKVPQPGDYEIKTSIVRYEASGQINRLGDAAWQQTPVAPVASRGRPKMTPQAGPVITSGQKNVTSRRWVQIAQWLITKGFTGRLHAISIQLDGDCEAQVIIGPNQPTLVKKDSTLQYQNLMLNKGEAVRVEARSRIGNKGSAHVMIQGELYSDPVADGTPVSKPRAPEHITEKEPKPEEPPRSLGEMIEEMRQREEVTV